MSVVTEYLESHGVPFKVLAHPRAYTGLAEARALGVEADEVLKTLVLDTTAGHAVVVIPSSRRLDMHLVRQAVGDPHAHLATEHELEGDFTGFELGAFPPLGGLLGVELLVDPEVREHERVAFAAGSQTESVEVRTEDLFRGEPARFVPLTEDLERE